MMRAIPTGKYQLNRGLHWWWLALPDGYLWSFDSFRDAVSAMDLHAKTTTQLTPEGTKS
jgi:hypothetical protein